MNYSTRWLPGFGLTDGEEMERIWSYMRRFSFMTKEMTPSHRVDLLTDALLHYRQKKIVDIGKNSLIWYIVITIFIFIFIFFFFYLFICITLVIM